MTASRLLLFLGLITGTATSQSSLPPEPLPGSSARSSAPASRKSKMTPEQARGLRLLHSAQAEAAAAEPPMHTFLLLQISRAYSKVDPARQDALLKSAFQASLAMPAEDSSQECAMPQVCRVKSDFQDDILLAISDRSTEAVLPLLPQAELRTRKLMTSKLADDYLHHDAFDRAEELLTQLAADPSYPFGIASELMARLPPARAGERLAIFNQAFNNFQQYQADSQPELQDFAGLLLRFWEHLPPDLVMDAIDAILDQARNPDSSANRVRIGFSTTHGDAHFNSAYEYRLFELLPLIDQLDPAKADTLRRENQNTHALLDRYPKGMQSLTPKAYTDQPRGSSVDTGFRSMDYSVEEDPTNAALHQAQREEEERQNLQIQAITKEAATDPKQALADAMALPLVGAFGPEISPRQLALQSVAQQAANKGNATVAKTALDEQRKSLDSLSPKEQGRILVHAAATYLKLGDPDSARKALNEALKIAENLYAKDVDAGDPNQAFKAYWPSTNLWSRIVATAARISPDFAEQILSSLPDSELATLVKVNYAASELGAGSLGESLEIEWRKEQHEEWSGVE